MGIGTGLTTWAAWVRQTRNDGLKRATSLERETGIEPVSLAWKAKVLPLNYSRLFPSGRVCKQTSLVEEGGFEPP